MQTSIRILCSMNAIWNEAQLLIDKYTIKGQTLGFDVNCWAQIS